MYKILPDNSKRFYIIDFGLAKHNTNNNYTNMYKIMNLNSKRKHARVKRVRPKNGSSESQNKKIPKLLF